MRAFVLLTCACIISTVAGFVPAAQQHRRLRGELAELARVIVPVAGADVRVSSERASVHMLAKAKKDVLELEGVVQEALPNAMFRVQLDDTEQVSSHSPP